MQWERRLQLKPLTEDESALGIYGAHASVHRLSELLFIRFQFVNSTEYGCVSGEMLHCTISPYRWHHVCGTQLLALSHVYVSTYEFCGIASPKSLSWRTLRCASVISTSALAKHPRHILLCRGLLVSFMKCSNLRFGFLPRPLPPP